MYMYVHTNFRRNLEYYDMCHNEKVRLCDSDCTANSGELTVKIPKDTYSTPGMGETLVINPNFVLSTLCKCILTFTCTCTLMS